MHLYLEDDRAIEYLAGQPVRKMSPEHRHSVVQLAFGQILTRLGRGRGTTGSEWRFRLSESAENRTELVPDVAFISYEHLQQFAEAQRQEPPCAPDIAVEVRSPDDRESRVLWKIRSYLDAGTLIVFGVFPDQRLIVAYTRDGKHEFPIGTKFEHAPIPWLRFDTAEAFALLEPWD
jgi:Uma2 family endonuclease